MPNKKIPAIKTVQGKMLRVKQFASGIGCGEKQQATLRGLGLGRVNRERELVDTCEVRGMVAKVAHLVKVIGE